MQSRLLWPMPVSLRPMHYVSVENLTKSFGIKPLFSNITFHINEGDKIAIIAKTVVENLLCLKYFRVKMWPTVVKYGYTKK